MRVLKCQFTLDPKFERDGEDGGEPETAGERLQDNLVQELLRPRQQLV